MKKRNRVVSYRTKKGKLNITARLTDSEWDQFRAKADKDGRSAAGRLAWLIRADLSSK